MQAATLQHPQSGQPSWTAPTSFEEFVPQTQHQYEPTALNYNSDPFSLASTVQGLANTHQQPPMNPYAHDPNALASASFYQNAGTFAQPVSCSLSVSCSPSDASSVGTIPQLRADWPAQREPAPVPTNGPRLVHRGQAERRPAAES